MPVQKTCLTCAAIFSVPPVRAATATTCSRACKSAMLREQYREGWQQKKCPQCERVFKFPDWQKNRVFCSEPCKWSSESAGWKVAEKSEGGSETQRTDGYIGVYLPRHPLGGVGRYVLKHRVVMEEWLRETGAMPEFMVTINGMKYLSPRIEVHHKDGTQNNNERSNLVACTRKAHKAMHFNLPVPEGQAWPLDGLLVSYVRRFPEKPLLP